MNFLSQKKKRTSLSERQNPQHVKSNFDNYYYKEVAKLTGAGCWSVNFRDKVSFLDPQGQKILNTPTGFKATPKTSLGFYADEDKEKAQKLFFECSTGIPFSTTIKMLTYDKKEFWAKASGEPLRDEKNAVIGIRGVFQDIDTEKLKELSLEKSIKVIASQNSRLFNFAHIVSHNLRSHSSNLQLTLQLLKTINSEKEEKELKQSLFDISESLNNTICHLNEIVSVQSQALQGKSEIFFEEILRNVKNSINRLILDTGTEIYSDFSEIPSIMYISAYMESILLNLITNSIKYKHPDRTPVIDIFTVKENNSDYLIVKDNGRGIDLESNKDKVFNMYQTFHRNEDAVGIGLFITKNQVETLQGTISIESTVDLSTTIKIKF
jgi:light-regulated signal transduction histidine kinase (bacteriophytochrome)